MRSATLFLIPCLLCLAIASTGQRQVKDSLQFYNSQLTKLYNRVWDSLKLDDSARFYSRQIRRTRERSKSYTAFSFSYGMMGTDFGAFNAAIAKDGFGPLHGPIVQFGLGFSHQTYSGIIIDVNYFMEGIGRRTDYNEQEIYADCSDYLQVSVGYAVINSRRFTVYPYAGLVLRYSQLNFSKPDTLNSSYNSIASLIHNDQEANGSNFHLGYQAGLGFDWVIGYHDKGRGGTILFVKGGTEGIFGSETYSISSIVYDSGIRYGAWVASVGVKLFSR